MVVTTRISSRLAALVLLGALAAGQAQAATTVVKASAKVAKPVTLSVKQDLDFGTIMLSGSPGDRTVTTAWRGF